jgi:hypothetical protein
MSEQTHEEWLAERKAAGLCAIERIPNPLFADRPDGDRFLLDRCVTHDTDGTDAFGHFLATRPAHNALGFAAND